MEIRSFLGFPRSARPGRRVAIGLVALGLLSACGATAGEKPSSSGSVRLTLGYFPNITHAPAIVGVERGIFARELGPGVRLERAVFNAGPQAVEALFAGAIDAAYIGPSPTINAHVKSRGEVLRIVSGATVGGASLVVRSGIDAPDDLRGAKLASPQLGNTQDVALRAWLKEHGLRTDFQGGGDVSVVPQENAQILETFRSGAIDGGWVPEPWATRLVQEGGGKVLVDEATLWPGGRFVTTHLVVRTGFLEEHPEVVRRLVQGQIAANDFLNANPQDSQQIVNAAIAQLTGKRLPDGIIAEAWKHLGFTNDPVASSLRSSASDAVALGLLEGADLDGIYDLRFLNDALRSAGLSEIGAGAP